MTQPKTKVWIHLILSTKDKLPLLHPDFENKIHAFLKEEITNYGCFVEMINGTADHVHAIFLLNPEKSLNKTVEELITTSAAIINKNYFSSGSFAWQPEYAAFSVSESLLSKMMEYIKNQKEHHKKQTFTNELKEFLKLHKLSK